MKAIAVFDIENDRIFDYSCELHVWNEFGDVRLVKKDALLRELPQKRINKDCLVVHEIWNEGWNACLEAIIGEDNG